jgi:outer membrane immunogenic protein
MLKKLLFSSIAVTSMLGSALAADLPSRHAPPPAYVPPAPIFTWTGFYIGVNGGFISREGTHVVGTPIFGNAGLVGGPAFGAAAPIAATFDLRRSYGGLAGGQIGYNWQVNQNIVLGVEADADGVFGNSCGGGGGGGFGGNNNCGGGVAIVPVTGFPANPLLAINSGTNRMDFIATLRGRLGFLPLPNLMIYGTGGLAVGGINSSITVQQQVTGPSAVPSLYGTTLSGCGNNNGGLLNGNNNNNCFRVGGTAGGGIEWMFLPGWSFKAEALYYELQAIRNTGTFSNFNTAGTLFTASGLNTITHPRGVIARAGINYHFSWGAPAPVVARY